MSLDIHDSRFDSNINYEMNSNRSQRYGTSFFVGLESSKTSDDEEKHLHSKFDSLYERKEDFNSDKEFSTRNSHQRYSQFSPNVEDIAYSVKRDLIRNYKESLNKQLDSFELFSTDFHHNLLPNSKSKPREVEFDFKTFRICPQKIGVNEEYSKETPDSSCKWDSDYLTKKDFLRHDEFTTTCNSFLKGSSDFISSRVKQDQNGLSSKSRDGLCDSTETFNKYDYVYAPPANEINLPFAYKNDEDLERRMKKFNLNEEEQSTNAKHDRKDIEKYDLRSNKDHFDLYDFENKFNLNGFKDESKSSESLSARNQLKSSYLPLKDVPVHDLVKKLRNEFELEGDIDRLSSKINVFWEKIETLLKAKAQIDQKLHETTTNEEKNAFERLNYILKNPIMSFLEGSTKKLSQSEVDYDKNKSQESRSKHIDTISLNCNRKRSNERKPDVKFKLEKDILNSQAKDAKYDSENASESMKRNVEKENLCKANDFMKGDEFLRLSQDPKLFSKKKPCNFRGGEEETLESQIDKDFETTNRFVGRKLTLQEAFERNKLNVIFRSQERVRNIKVNSERRKFESTVKTKVLLDNLSSNKYKEPMGTRNVKESYHNSDRFDEWYANRRKKLNMSSKEIKKQNLKNYKKLPEVRQREIKKSLDEVRKANRIKSFIFKKAVQQHVLSNGPNFPTKFKALKSHNI